MTVPVLGDDAHPSAPHLGRRERALLAALVLTRPGAAAPETLADAVWTEAPPSTWPKQLQASVGRLRRVYGAAAIETVAGGYRLALPADTIDVEIFEGAVERARGYARDGEHDRAVATLERALRLWTGEPYRAIEEWDRASAEISRITELKLSAEDDLLRERLAAGDHRTVAAVGAGAVNEEPLREGRWLALATALYRCDRQAEALTVLHRAGGLLRDELGLDPSPAMVELQARILRHDASLLEVTAPVPADEQCPYKGLEAYGPGDADEFFGRGADIALAMETLDRTRFLVLVGASGSGKSSLLRAGVGPLHRSRGIRVVEHGPEMALSVWEPDVAGDALVIVDHLESLFAPGASPEAARAACAALAEHHRAGGRVAIGMRSDALDQLTNDPSIGPLLSGSVQLVATLRDDALREAVEQPAALAHLTLEHGFTDVVLTDAAGAAGALPLLSHALAETWLRREGSTLTIDGYQASGGLRGAVARSAERVYENLTVEDRRRCSMIFRRLVQLTPTGNVVATPLAWTTLASSGLDAVANRLTAARLLVAGDHHVELAHESIVRAWPRLRSWLEEDVEGQRALTHLSTTATMWDALDRPPAELYRGPRLTLAVDWAERSADDLTAVEREFLAASLDAEAAEATAAAEVETQQRRARSRTRRLRAGVVGAAVAALGATAIAFVAFQVASASGASEREQRDRAQLEALVGDSTVQQSTSREAALLLAVEAYLRWPESRAAQGALLSAFEAEPGFRGNLHLPYDVAPFGVMLPDGNRAVLGTTAGLDIIAVDTGELKMSIWSSVDWEMHGSPWVHVDAAGDTAAMIGRPASCSGSQTFTCVGVGLYDLDRGQELTTRILPDTGIGTDGSDLSPDGHRLATIDARTGDLHVFDSLTGDEVAGLGLDLTGDIEFDYAGSVAFVDDTTAVFGTADNRIIAIDAASGQIISDDRAPVGFANVAMVATGAGTVLTSGDEGVMAWDLALGQSLWTHAYLPGTPETCRWLSVALIRDLVLCGSQYGVVETYALSTGLPTGDRYAPQQGDVGPIAVTPDGSTMMTFGIMNPVISRWSLDGSGPVTRLIAPGRAAVDGFTGDGRLLLTAVRTDAPDSNAWNTFSVWNVESNSPELTLDPGVREVAWFGDQHLVADFGSDEGLGFVDIATGDRNGDASPLVGVNGVVTGADRAHPIAFFPSAFVQPWDAESLRPLEQDIRTPPNIYAGDWPEWIATSVRGDRLAIMTWSGRHATTQIFDARTGESVTRREAGLGWPAMAPDGRVVAIMLDEPGVVGRFDPQLELLGTTHAARGAVTQLGMSADGSMFVVAGGDGAVAAFDMETGDRFGGSVTAAAPNGAQGFLSPDGRTLAVNIVQGVALWNLDPATLADAACRTAGRNLTHEEWAAYLSDLGEWRATCVQYGYPDAASS